MIDDMDTTSLDQQYTEPLPFESYPQHGHSLLGSVRGNNCRHGYGLEYIKKTKQTYCAYCGLDLMGVYENWLNMALDHVVPYNVCQMWNVPREWSEDYSNRVLSCTTCNTFGNRYVPQDFQPPTTLEEFYQLRDAIFVERRRLILERHQQERAFFEKVKVEMETLADQV